MKTKTMTTNFQSILKDLKALVKSYKENELAMDSSTTPYEYDKAMSNLRDISLQIQTNLEYLVKEADVLSLYCNLIEWNQVHSIVLTDIAYTKK